MYVARWHIFSRIHCSTLAADKRRVLYFLKIEKMCMQNFMAFIHHAEKIQRAEVKLDGLWDLKSQMRL